MEQLLKFQELLIDLLSFEQIENFANNPDFGSSPQFGHMIEIGQLNFELSYLSDQNKRDTKDMFDELDLTTAEFSAVVNFESGQGAIRTREIYNLPKHECMVLVTGYSVKLRSEVLKRWQLLEDAEAERLQVALVEERESRAKIQKEYSYLSFQILTGKSSVRADMFDWRLRFRSLISAHSRKPDMYGFKHTPKDAVDALAPYADDALRLISIALNAKMALGTSMVKCGVGVDTVHKVLEEFITYVEKETGDTDEHNR